ncbi:ribosomal protein L5 [Neolentinus lepideus HHB14362 ss-1]|uniref:Ribosomal protein L5 n=1 Tax=Neolentinus lepideus HHB14362 ss-1 TaxID=1314782 RepID=A0A165UWB9_9AGAM|nr:ribosomal protein L5 [Neolentinus lepideus HHB14362 ss-1]
MSAAPAVARAAGPARQAFSLRPSRTPPKIRKPLKRDDQGLPIPRCKIFVRDTHPSRMMDHYFSTLQDDLMYMTYVHESGPRKPPREIRLKFDPEDPYSKNRVNTPVGGSQLGRKPAPVTSWDNVVQLERVQIHTMIKEATSNRVNLLGPIMMMRALSGETEGGGGRHTSEGVQVVRSIKTVGGWLRPRMPIGAKVDLKGPKMYDFISTLTEFVLPRLREYTGFVMPASTQQNFTPSSVSGVVSIGLPPEAMGLFPQIEVNLDAYPGSYGMHIHFITNAEGQGAQNKARALLSGLQVPFVRR